MSRRQSVRGARTRHSRSFSFIGSSYARRLQVEALEDRRMLAVLTVQNNLDDTLANLAGDGELSLREAIEIANNPGTVIDGFVSNDVADTIEFSIVGAISLDSQLPTISEDLSIDGSSQITLDAGGGTNGEIGNGDGFRILDIHDGTGNVIDVTLIGLTLTGGDPNGAGGAIRNTENLTLELSTITGNASNTRGGGIYNYSGTLTINNLSSITGNATVGRGGGIYSESGAVIINNSTVNGNSTMGDRLALGGGIFSRNGSVTLTDSSVSENSSLGRNGSGGGIFTDFGAVTLTNSTIIGNSSGSSGAGISTNSGVLTLASSTVSGNNATGFDAEGGGIYSRSGAVTLTNSTVSGNSATGIEAKGGGIFSSYGALTLTSSTVTNNTASQSDGGGIWIADTSINPEFIVLNSIIAGNSADGSAPDLRPDPDSVLTLNYSLIGDNTDTALIEAQTADSNGNLIGNGMRGRTIDPLLGPLVDNGGPTFTHALLDGSPAIDAGNSPLLIDQRELPRPFDVNSLPNTSGNGSDIGAFERQTVPSTFLPTGVTVFFETISDVDLSATRIIADSGAAVTVTLSVNAGVFALPADGSGIGSGVTAALVSPQVINLVGRADDVNLYLDNPSNVQYLPPAGIVGDDIATITVDINGSLLGNVNLTAVELPSLVVTTSADEEDEFDLQTSLREAIGYANQLDGADTITFDAGVFTGGAANRIDLDGTQLEVFDALSIDATALTENVTIDAQQMSRVLLVGTSRDTFDASLAGLDITNGDVADAGGGILFGSSGTLTLNRSVVSGNSSGLDGGGISAYAGIVILAESSVSGNSTSGRYAVGGGISGFDGSVILTDSTLSGNSTSGNDAHGGGIYLRSGPVTITNSNISGNSTSGANADGGGVHLREAALTVANSTISGNNSGLRGGGISSFSGPVSITNSIISENVSRDNGGGIHMRVRVLTITNSTVSGNSTTGFSGGGGGISTYNGTVTLTRSTVVGNSTAGAQAEGGGVFSDSGAVTLIDSSVSGNSTTGSRADGGGIHTCYGNVMLANSTVSSNSTAGNSAQGGGIHTREGAVTIISSTISGNTSGDNGGGIYTRSGEVTLSESTVTNNAAARAMGGGVFVANSSINPDFVLMNSIIAGNIDNGTLPNLRQDPGSALSISYSLIGDNSGTTLTEAQTPDGNGNLIGSAAGGGIIDPLLGPLADNGGPTRTHALLPGSPALNAGDPSIPFLATEFDQRGVGYSRVAFDRIDIGAYEAHVTPSADFDFDDDVDGSDFLAWQHGFGQPNALRMNGNSDDDTDVDASDLAAWRVSYGDSTPPLEAELSAVSSQPSAVATSELIDAAMAWELRNLPGDDQAEAVDEQLTPEAATSALSPNARFFAPPQSRTAYRDVEATSKPEDTDEPWLSDELLERVFGYRGV